MESQTIRHMIEDNCADGIPLPNVNSKILSKVIEYCNKHVHAAAAASKAGSDDAGATATNSTAASGEDHKNWDADFVKVDKATLFDLILVKVSVFPLPPPAVYASLVKFGSVIVRVQMYPYRSGLICLWLKAVFTCVDCGD
ncbi:hypothetical protein SEVIR_5G177650v4 [Setaria viridis]|uniref:SKP1-like protein 1 isoform X1 n=1 Tax=Setaria viridis TaxID=4556 RepID=UPI003B3A5692